MLHCNINKRRLVLSAMRATHAGILTLCYQNLGDATPAIGQYAGREGNARMGRH
ncbi:hypothetical protein SAMN05421890_4722 [Ensifer adhaerens]|nr:hypothetical protein SAMN05421890_4722 [Ensifer adhaerens]